MNKPKWMTKKDYMGFPSETSEYSGHLHFEKKKTGVVFL